MLRVGHCCADSGEVSTTPRATSQTSMRTMATAVPGRAGRPSGRPAGSARNRGSVSAEVMVGPFGSGGLASENITTSASSRASGLWRLPGRGLVGLLARLGRVPERFHLLEGRRLRCLAAMRERALDGGKTLLEFPIRRAQRRFRIDIEVARQVHHREQQIAHLGAGSRAAARGDLGLDLVRLFADLGEHGQGIVPIEADFAGLGLQLERAREGGEPDGDAGKRPGLAAAPRGFLRALPFLLTLLRLDALPQSLDRLRREPARVAEHVRMAPDELLGQGLHDVAEVESALLLRHPGVEYDLEQEVAQLVTQVLEVAPHNGVGNLVGLLDGVGRDGRKALLKVPRTTGSGRAQRRHDVDEPGDVAGRSHGSNLQDGAMSKARAPDARRAGTKLRCLAAPCPAAAARETPMAATRPGHPQQKGSLPPQWPPRSASRLASNRNQQRFSASSMKFSWRLAVATSPCLSATSCASRMPWICALLSFISSSSMSMAAT